MAICSQLSEHFPIFFVEHQLTSVHQLLEHWQLVVRGMAKQEGEGEVKWGSQHPNKMLWFFKLMLQWQKPNDFICGRKKFYIISTRSSLCVLKSKASKWFGFDWNLGNPCFYAIETLFSPIFLLLSCYFVYCISIRSWFGLSAASIPFRGVDHAFPKPRNSKALP